MKIDKSIGRRKDEAIVKIYATTIRGDKVEKMEGLCFMYDDCLMKLIFELDTDNILVIHTKKVNEEEHLEVRITVPKAIRESFCIQQSTQGRVKKEIDNNMLKLISESGRIEIDINLEQDLSKILKPDDYEEWQYYNTTADLIWTLQ